MALLRVPFRRLLPIFGTLAVATLSPRLCPAAESQAPAKPALDFSRQILPILSENCFACHGPDAKQRKAKLRLDTKAGAFAKLRHGGFAIVPGNSANSVLIERITASEPSELMPPPKTGKHLTPQQIALLKQWIDQGAPWAMHWAFVPPRRPPLPKVCSHAERGNEEWVRNPIDHFVLARLEAEGISPSPQADKAALLRRVSLDLTGLPPTLAEVDAFLADSAANAYEKVVDRLLASPRYGEHLGRFWLDAARYADTHGMHEDYYREIWPYRDWVIAAFNKNLPFDQFIVEQLAGDLLANPTLDQQVASGFNRCHMTTNEGGSIVEEVLVRYVVDRVDTVGTVFLGLSIGCGRCHDHKYDPITQKDYYQLFAFFNSLEEIAIDKAARSPPVVYVAPAEQVAALEQLKKKVAAIRRKIAAEVANVRNVGSKELSAWIQTQQAAGGTGLPKEIQPLVKLASAARSENQNKQLREYFIEHVYAKTRPVFAPLHQQLAAAEKERDRLDREMPATLVSRERCQPQLAYILKRGEYDQKGEQVSRNTPAFLPPLPRDFPRNRLGFARWLAARDNPLTARVAVNRLWQVCFGRGIVPTAEDFGAQGEPPSHPELLDWLAVQFQEDGWDVKKLLRRIVTSATYRQSSRATGERLAKDPANRLLSRGPRFRLHAEMLRDQALAVSGLLYEKVGGPSVKPPQPPGLWEAVSFAGSNTAHYVADQGPDKVYRRSLYTFWKRQAPPPQMSLCDAPARETCVVRREQTNTPLQALLLLNETQYVACARALAERALRQGAVRSHAERGNEEAARLTYMFRLATARRPRDEELTRLLTFFRENLAAYSRDGEGARKLIAVGETKPDPRFAPAELAAWTLLANLILNLDEVLNH